MLKCESKMWLAISLPVFLRVVESHDVFVQTGANSVEVCYLAMNEKRLRFILRCLCFDNLRERIQSREIDTRAPIREPCAKLLENF